MHSVGGTVIHSLYNMDYYYYLGIHFIFGKACLYPLNIR